MLKLITGYRMLIDSAWFLTFVRHSDDTVTVVEYDRDHMPIDRAMGRAEPVESAGRVITAIIYEGQTLTVRNPAFVFSYKA